MSSQLKTTVGAAFPDWCSIILGITGSNTFKQLSWLQDFSLVSICCYTLDLKRSWARVGRNISYFLNVFDYTVFLSLSHPLPLSLFGEAFLKTGLHEAHILQKASLEAQKNGM